MSEILFTENKSDSNFTCWLNKLVQSSTGKKPTLFIVNTFRSSTLSLWFFVMYNVSQL